MPSNFIKQINLKIDKAKLLKKLIVFTISSTAKQEKNPYHAPLREYDDFCILGCVLFDQTLLVELLKFIDKEVDIVLVDAEKKIPLHEVAKHKKTQFIDRTIGSFETGNFSKLCFNNIKNAKVFEYKPNDLTVDAAWIFISQKLNSFTGKKISILGLGNIGSKLALKIVECGANVHVYSKDFNKTHLVSQALNLIKPNGTIASITCHRDPLSATFASDVLLGAKNGIPIINSEIISSVHKDCIVIDLGKNNLTEDAIKISKKHKLEICRTDVTNSLETFVKETLIVNKKLKKDYGSRSVNEINIVGGGYFGSNGSIIVDSIKAPKRILGVSDGKGATKNRLSSLDKESIAKLVKYFNIKN